MTTATMTAETNPLLLTDYSGRPSCGLIGFHSKQCLVAALSDDFVCNSGASGFSKTVYVLKG